MNLNLLDFLSNPSETISASTINGNNSLKLFKNKNVVYTGNPRSEEIINVKAKSKKELGFDKDKKLVVVKTPVGECTLKILAIKA